MGCKFERQAKGSHELWINPQNGKKTVIPNWGAKELRTGLIRNVLRDLDIDPDEFRKI
jgi:predicted RNA binding protein YcfA (HicA-like mRNA interferase family)